MAHNGHLQIQVTDTAAVSAVVNAIFFDPVPAATYLGTDTTTLGTWTGNYGANGQVIPDDVSNVPSFAVLSLSGASEYLWAATTTDPRALRISSASSSGIASVYDSSGSFTLDLNLIDGNTHKVSLYLGD